MNDLGIEIRVAHFPSYCSKYNPIERRLFPHITRVCQGLLFDAVETVVGLMRKASTRTGLRTTVNVIRRMYETKLKVAADFKETMTILFDDEIPKWKGAVTPIPAFTLQLQAFWFLAAGNSPLGGGADPSDRPRTFAPTPG